MDNNKVTQIYIYGIKFTSLVTYEAAVETYS